MAAYATAYVVRLASGPRLFGMRLLAPNHQTKHAQVHIRLRNIKRTQKQKITNQTTQRLQNILCRTCASCPQTSRANAYTVLDQVSFGRPRALLPTSCAGTTEPGTKSTPLTSDVSGSAAIFPKSDNCLSRSVIDMGWALALARTSAFEM